VADEPPRTRAARRAAEAALVRVLHHYGATPEFVLRGGLVPELLCSTSGLLHAGTTDVDVQVNLEIAAGAVHVIRLEEALANAEFEPDPEHVWRWQTVIDGRRAVIKFELLADLDDQRQGAVVSFDDCQALGAVNLRGTRFAALDYAPRTLRSHVDGVAHQVNVNVAGLAGFLLAKTAAAYSRRKEKDWYDIAFVLLHNDAGGPRQAAQAIRQRFGAELVGATATPLRSARSPRCAPRRPGPPRRPAPRNPSRSDRTRTAPPRSRRNDQRLTPSPSTCRHRPAPPDTGQVPGPVSEP
jgi:hypothetical protein